MKCQLCKKEGDLLVFYRHYSSRGIMLCPSCQQKVSQHCHQPYSKVMERLAIAETGYRINRKLKR